MRIVAFAALAASAAAFAPAAAQTVQDPDPYYGVPPPPPGNMPPPHRSGPPGVTWQGSQGQMHMGGSMGAPQMHPGGAMPPHRMMMPMGPMHPGMQGQMRHVQRGGRVPPAWANQRFEVRDWRRFGFPAPFAGGRWIRFYDDALLIDGGGLVYDSRPDWRWDGDAEERGQEEHGYEERGYGEGGYGEGMGRGREGGREREWNGREQREENVRTRVYVTHGAPPPPPGYGGYGYGYGYGPVVVTETTVTEPAVVEQRTWVRTYVERVHVAHRRHHVRRCGCRAAPAPVLGERG
jgi:Ni/Co efflux regulator RcnB